MSGFAIQPPLTIDDINAAFLSKFQSVQGNPAASTDDMFNNVMAAKAVYVSNAAVSLNSLLTNFPAGPLTNNLYARVSDLYGSVDDVMRCRYDGTNYRWVPQRESMTGTSAISSGTLQLLPLFTPTTMQLTSTALSGNVSVTPSPVNAYKGMYFDVVMPPVINLGLFTAQITGLIGSNISLLANTSRRIGFNGSGFFQVT